MRERLTYANVMSSIAVFLVLGGATALAAGKLAKNSVGTRQLKPSSVTTAKIKKNAVTGAKVKDGSLLGTDIQVSTLGTVPSATTAKTAASLTGQTPFLFLMPAGVKDIATIGPFTVKASCVIDPNGSDVAELQLFTAVNGAAMDDNSGAEEAPFDIAENPGEMLRQSATHDVPNIESDQGQLIAVAPDGTTIATENQAVGVNVAGHPGQCFFAGTLVKLGVAGVEIVP